MRKNYISVLKVISIILVIVIHSLSRSWNNMMYVNVDFFKTLTFIDCLVLVSVPIFIMCSGAIFLNRDDSIKKLFLKYALRIYLLFLIFNFTYMTFDNVINQGQAFSFSIIKNNLIDSILLKPTFHMWYLKDCVIFYLCTPIFKLFTKKNNTIIDTILLLFLITLFIILPNQGIISIPDDFRYLVYYYLGYYLDKYSNKYSSIIFGLLSIFTFIHMYTNTVNLSISAQMPNITYMNYLSYDMFIISIFAFSISKLLLKKESNIITYISKLGLYIYLVHGFVIGLVSRLKIVDIFNLKNIFELLLFIVITYIISLGLSASYLFIKDKIKEIIKEKKKGLK